MARINKTVKWFDWENGHCKDRELSRSFDTKEEALKFAEGKHNTDVYMSKGRYKVTWHKVVTNMEGGE